MLVCRDEAFKSFALGNMQLITVLKSMCMSLCIVCH